MENEPSTDHTEPVEEWPPRYWRETTRGMGRRQAAYVAGGMFGIIIVLVLISIWAAHTG
jgi:hypothetical protein